MARLWLPDRKRQMFGVVEKDPTADRERVFMGLPESKPLAEQTSSGAEEPSSPVNHVLTETGSPGGPPPEVSTEVSTGVGKLNLNA